MDRQKRIKLAIERQRIKLEYLVEKDSSLEGLLAESTEAGSADRTLRSGKYNFILTDRRKETLIGLLLRPYEGSFFVHFHRKMKEKQRVSEESLKKPIAILANPGYD